MNIHLTNKSPEKAGQEFIFYTETEWQNNTSVYPEGVQNLFKGKKNEVFIIAEAAAIKFLIGLGKNTERAEVQKLASKFAHDYRDKIQGGATLLKIDGKDGEFLKSAVSGLFLGTYQYPFREQHVFFNKNFQLTAPEITDAEAEKLTTEIHALCEGRFACMEWLNKPQNFKKTPHLVAYLNEIAEKYALNIEIFGSEECEKLGLGAFLCVNQGSAQEAAFTVLQYDCGHPDAKTVGLVGKCVLFDTGGLSIKPSDNLHYMKSDMGGATAVIGTLITAAQKKLPVNITAILPITDNAVSASAYVPSDVVQAYNGKTIEIINTDAEGRLTLADGLSYLAKNYQTDVLIDLATLTGSAVRMFGNTCGALFSNNDLLRDALLTAGHTTGEKLWALPLWDEWTDEIQSDVADLKNISLKPVGDCIIAAKFLEHFTEGHTAWAHLDIAGVAFGNTVYAKEKAATGYGVELLTEFLENFA